MYLVESWIREWINPNLKIKDVIEKINKIGFEINSFYSFKLSKKFILGKVMFFKKLYDSYLLVTLNINKNNSILAIFNGNYIKINSLVLISKIENPYFKNINIKNKFIKYKVHLFNEVSFKNKNLENKAKRSLLGTNLTNFFNLYNLAFKLEKINERDDCNYILGIVREISSTFSINFKLNNFPKKLDNKINKKLRFNVKILDPKYCPKYFFRIIKNINISRNIPYWIKERLKLSNFKYENSIFDITNYILLELGQPVNIMDMLNIKKKIVLRKAISGEFLIVKNNKIKLSDKSLVLSDNEKILSLIPGINSTLVDINENTKDIFIESVSYNPSEIKYNIKKYKISNKFSEFFFKKIDFSTQKFAIERITELIVDIFGGTPSPIFGFVNKVKTKIIRLKYLNLFKIIGLKITEKKIINILTRLGYKIKNKNTVYIDTVIPSWRTDIKNEDDIIEDILRMYGYSKIPIVPIKSKIFFSKKEKKKKLLNKIKLLLTNRGYQEVITYSFIRPSSQLFLKSNINPLIVSNPISYDYSSMRLSLIPGILKTVSYNQNRKQKNIKIFESGLCFIPNEKFNLFVEQKLMISGAISGNKFNSHWSEKYGKLDFYDLKGDLESVFCITNYNINNFEFKNNKNIDFLCPIKSSKIFFKNKFIGYFGLINKENFKKFNLKHEVIVFEIYLNYIELQDLSFKKNIPKTPVKIRDISIKLKKCIPYYIIMKECKKIIKNKLVDIEVFDMYKENKDSEKITMSIRLFIQDNKNMKNEEINDLLTKTIEALKLKFNVLLK
ncbi:MAG: phenylalanine--tRNA ligase subunit beta [Enterobacteriaceae bacterium]